MIIEDDNGKPMCACDLCGHKWYPRRNKEPWKCPNIDCQSTRWNEDTMVLTQLDQLSLLKELERRNKNSGDEYGMDSDVVDSKVRKTIEQMKHEENLERSLHNTNERLKSLEEKLGNQDECPNCNNMVPSNARRCPYCEAEYEQGGQ